jgi:hypothetical protein
MVTSDEKLADRVLELFWWPFHKRFLWGMAGFACHPPKYLALSYIWGKELESKCCR